ncbi:MAG: alpha/beta fold hydrolase [Pirellulales bacterium]|nr:alpha/beta fold hydrolase [Pirellulales bacterium]
MPPETTPPSDADWRTLYPFASHYLDLGGLRYHYLDEGRGPALLMAHGNPTWSFYWRELVKAFRGRYRVVVPDHIGCGLSDKPHPRDYPYRLARRIDDLGELIRRLDLRDVTLVAHDWGGAIGMGAAVAMPERFSRFVLLNTAAFRSDRIPWRINLCRVPILGPVAVEGLNLFVRAALRSAVARPERLSPAVRRGLAAPYDTWAHRAAVLRFVWDVPMKPSHPSYARLAEIEQGLAGLADRPVCLIWGMKDWCFTPEFLDRFLDFFPSAEVHRLDDAGHYVVEEAPEEVIAAIKRFLEGARRAGAPAGAG